MSYPLAKSVAAVWLAATLGGCEQHAAGTDPLRSISQAPTAAARADVQPTQGNSVRGSVDFSRDSGVTIIRARLSGLSPGQHGLHVHEVGDCSAPDGSSAGPHFAPEHDQHGAPTDAPPLHHLGDLGNISADAQGNAEARIEDAELTIDAAMGVVGRSVIVHLGQDDLKSQPSGNSGAPVACGVIKSVAAGRG